MRNLTIVTLMILGTILVNSCVPSRPVSVYYSIPKFPDLPTYQFVDVSAPTAKHCLSDDGLRNAVERDMILNDHIVLLESRLQFINR